MVSSLRRRVADQDDVRRIALAVGQASSAVSQVSDGSNLQLYSLQKTAQALNQSIALGWTNTISPS